VITVTPTKQRALNLCEKLQRTGLAFKRFWFTDLGPLCADDSPRFLRNYFLRRRIFARAFSIVFGITTESVPIQGTIHLTISNSKTLSNTVSIIPIHRPFTAFWAQIYSRTAAILPADTMDSHYLLGNLFTSQEIMIILEITLFVVVRPATQVRLRSQRRRFVRPSRPFYMTRTPVTLRIEDTSGETELRWEKCCKPISEPERRIQVVGESSEEEDGFIRRGCKKP
jgi:hypothetical protein